MARDFQHFRDELERLRPQVENPDVLRLIESLIDNLETQHAETSRKLDRLSESLRQLDSRILTVENSRVYRILHKVSHTLRAWNLGDAAGSEARAYQLWLEREEHAAPPAQWFRDAAAKLDYRPKFGVLLHVSQPRREWLEAAVASVLRQSYPDWELCVCDDACVEPWVSSYLSEQAARDSRIHFVRSAEPMGSSSSLNRAMMLSSGDYIATLDQHAVLSQHALYYAAERLQDRRCDLLYADHDRFSAGGSRERPCFKPAWSPELLAATMYLGRFLVISTHAFPRAGGFRSEFDGAHLHDLALRVTEPGSTILHLPHVLASERTEDAATDQERRAIEAALLRRDCSASVELADKRGFRIRRSVTGSPLVSLIICSRNARLLAKCLESIERKTGYSKREVVVVQHGSESALSSLLDRSNCIRVLHTGAFNFAAMNNRGMDAASGEILVFMNDDVRPLSATWLEALIAQVERPEVGVAGAQLVYPSGLIQHAGMAVGIMDGAGHPHRGTSGGGFWHWSFHARNVSAVTGACMATRRKVFEELGGFDLQFPVNYNDVDLCLRARQVGFEVIYEPAARLEHSECKSRSPGVSWQERELWHERWGQLLEKGDPYYSRQLARNREDCSLRDG